MNNLPLIVKYRPDNFGQVLGHEVAIGALQRVLKSASRPHAFLFSGPSGLGKTTLARIIGNQLEADINEIDAASNSGVDAMRQLVEMSQYMSMTGAGCRLLLIDECFAKGTQVNTPTGNKAIERLVPGDHVLGATGPQRLKNTFKNRVPLTRIIKLRLKGKPAILCSEDHAFLTNEGWIAAKELTSAHRLQEAAGGISIQSKVLRMWDNNYEQGRRGRPALRSMQTSAEQEDLFRMRNRLLEEHDNLFIPMRRQKGIEEAHGTKTACLESIIERSLIQTSGISSRESTSSTIIFAHDDQQSNAQGRRKAKNDRDKNAQRNFSSNKALAGREWARTFPSAANASSNHWRNNGVWNLNQQLFEKNEVPPFLQSRYCVASNKASRRNRWGLAFYSRSENSRREEGRMLAGARLESSSHLEQYDIEELRRSGQTCFVGDIECSTFYDLEVEGHPSYAVEGVIVHNCHRLSRPAFDAILKLLEEPPEHLFLALCTTELVKVPPTIIGRCYHVQLNPLKPVEIEDLLTVVCELEEWQVRPDIFQMVVQSCEGSPRNALSLMQKVHDLPTRDEAKRVLALIEAGDPLIDLLQHLIAGKESWKVIRAILERIEPDAWEDAATIAGRYIMGALIRAEDEKSAARIWQLLDALVFPSNTYDRKAAFVAAIGRMIWGGH